ncbi:TrmB family transcriptional regulator [Halobaculum sp. MBLA0147]|uniref:TrmB family transcriptional regulator n=1 Tax=Halobaculum sp. MBLA0147 TaxID=3079934 RepID=UPI00352679EA
MQSTHAERTTESLGTERTDETDGADESGGVSPASVAVPAEIDSPRGKLVYLYLATHGAVTDDELCEGLDMTRLSLYSVLDTLRGADIVSREDSRYVLN